jgi:hypothetical protein
MTAVDPLSRHGAHVHTGFHTRDPGLQDLHTTNHALLRQFLSVMDEAGRPGIRRKLGSTMLQLAGQPTEHYWSTMLRDGQGHCREVLIFDDGTHGWGDEISYSDRPRNGDDEMSPALLRTALEQILSDQDLRWPDHPAQPRRAEPAVVDRESRADYRHHREAEYAWMMGIRLLFLVAAVVVAAQDVPYAPLWIALLGLGMVFLPMIAVFIANDHHPRPQRRGHRWLHVH